MGKFLDLTANGVATGMIYALIALGFVIIYKATHVLNFAQGGFVVLGAYFTYNVSVTWGLPFPLACVIAVVMTAALGVVVERLVLRRMVGQPVLHWDLPCPVHPACSAPAVAWCVPSCTVRRAKSTARNTPGKCCLSPPTTTSGSPP